KYYAKPTNNNLRTSLASSSAKKKPEYVKSEEKKEDKKADEKKRDMSEVKCSNYKKEGRFAKDCKKAKVKNYNYYKTNMLLAKKDGDEQVLLADDKLGWSDVNDAMGYKKKVVVVTSDPLTLVAEKIKVSKRKEKVILQTESEGSEDEDISDLKKITALLAKAFNRKKYYAKPTNNNLRTSLASSSAKKKPEYVKSEEKKEDKKADEKKRDMSEVKCFNYKKEGRFAKDCKKAKVKNYNYYKTNMLLAKKDGDEQVLLADDKLGWSPVVIQIKRSVQIWSS
nr:hypothetical protein [Tanacetum cinerariifolium]